MKKTIALIALTLILVSSNAYAKREGIYVGYKYGETSVEIPYLESEEKSYARGYFAGFTNAKGIGLEIEKTTLELSSGEDTVELETSAIYAITRIGDEFFIKTKGGYAKEEVKVISAEGENPIEPSNNSGLSYGLGLGFQMSYFLGEIEYTKHDSDVDYISLGLALRF